MKPRVDALRVEAMVTFRQFPVGFTTVYVVEAYGAVDGGGGARVRVRV